MDDKKDETLLSAFFYDPAVDLSFSPMGPVCLGNWFHHVCSAKKKGETYRVTSGMIFFFIRHVCSQRLIKLLRTAICIRPCFYNMYSPHCFDYETLVYLILMNCAEWTVAKYSLH